MLLWVTLSAWVIMLNKYILDPKMGGFPYPVALTCMHMSFCSALAWSMVQLGLAEAPSIPFDIWLRCEGGWVCACRHGLRKCWQTCHFRRCSWKVFVALFSSMHNITRALHTIRVVVKIYKHNMNSM